MNNRNNETNKETQKIEDDKKMLELVGGINPEIWDIDPSKCDDMIYNPFTGDRRPMVLMEKVLIHYLGEKRFKFNRFGPTEYPQLSELCISMLGYDDFEREAPDLVNVISALNVVRCYVNLKKGRKSKIEQYISNYAADYMSSLKKSA